MFANFDWGDALHNPASLVRDFASNLVQEASFLPPFDVPYTCPVYLPLPDPERTDVMVCGDAGADPAALLPGHFGLRRVGGCAPEPSTAVLFVTSRADVADLDGAALRAWLSAGGRIVTAGGRGRAVHDLVFETVSPPGARTGDCGGDVLPAWRYEPGGRFWADVPWTAPERTGCGEDLVAIPGLTPLGGWDARTVSLGYRDLGDGRLYTLEADFTEAGATLSRAGRDLVRFLALGRPEGISFSGVRLGVPEDELLDGGFTPCLVTTYGSFEPIDDLRAQCDGDVLVLGCRPAGETDLQVAAMGARDEVFTEVGPAFDAAHPHNGVLWYLDPQSGWGFAPLNAGGVDRFPCDVLDPRAPDRLCWQASDGELNPGYRCGADTAFDASFERVVYMRDGRL
jgi:hypothetical protein